MKMSNQRFAEYQSEIIKLQKKDKLTTQRIEKEFLGLDSISSKQERGARERLLKKETFDIELDKENSFVTSRGIENIFTGNNELHWEQYEIFEIFYNNIFDFTIKIENY